MRSTRSKGARFLRHQCQHLHNLQAAWTRTSSTSFRGLVQQGLGEVLSGTIRRREHQTAIEMIDRGGSLSAMTVTARHSPSSSLGDGAARLDPGLRVRSRHP